MSENTAKKIIDRTPNPDKPFELCDAALRACEVGAGKIVGAITKANRAWLTPERAANLLARLDTTTELLALARKTLSGIAAAKAASDEREAARV